MGCFAGSALVGLSDVRDFLNDATLTNDAVAVYINAISGAFEAATGVRFAYRTSTFTYDGSGSKVLVLGEWPVTTIHSVHVDTSRVWGADTEWVENTDFVAYLSRGILQTISTDSSSAWNASWPKSVQTVKIVMDVGFPTIPYEIQGAALNEIQTMFAKKGKSAEVRREKILNYEVEYMRPTENRRGSLMAQFLDSTAEVLSRYVDLVSYKPMGEEA
jgi:hypothetical protein